MTRKVHWICASPTPYNAFLFRALAAEIDLVVHYMAPSSGASPWRSDLRRGYVSRVYRKVLGIDWSLIGTVLRDDNSILVSGGWRGPTVQLALTLCALRSVPFALWTDTPQLNRRRSRLKAVLRARWLRWLFGNARAVMGTGAPALVALRQMGAPQNALANLPYFVDLALFPPASRSFDPHRVRFASVGRLSHEKGYDLALEALGVVFKEDPTRLSYRIAGSGPEEANLKKLAVKLGIERQVQFRDWLEPDSVPTFLAGADVFLHTARVEPYGVAVLEAMAAGMLVIGSDATAAVLDRIQQGVNGFVFCSEDVQDLVAQIRLLLDRSEEWSRVGRAARATAEQWPVSRAVDTVRAVLAQ